VHIDSFKIRLGIDINFIDGLPTVLIGKNGSGKTNILEALTIIAEANGNYWGSNSKEQFSYKIHLQLSEDDILRLFPDKTVDSTQCSFVAYSGEKMKIDRVESNYLASLFCEEIAEIQSKSNELKKLLSEYQNQLGYVSNDSDNSLPTQWYQISKISNSCRPLTNFDSLSRRIQHPVEEAEKIANSLSRCISNDKNIFTFAPLYNYYPIKEDFSFKLEYAKPELAPFEEKHITINETGIKQEIAKINKETQVLCDKISSLLKEIDNLVARLKNALGDDEIGISQPNSEFFCFIHEIHKCVGAKCSFLKNENSDLIFKDLEKEQRSYCNDNALSVLKTYILKVYDGSDKNDLPHNIANNKDFSLSDQAILDFESYLNSNLPDFEKGMYKSVSVERVGEKSVSIFLHEQSGEKVNLNNTSSGRRWYFTYYFTKNTLEPGDLFIIDEPAASLHPLAQKEVLNELLDLEKQGVAVIYATHSPYLIPDEWKCVHFVSMGENGTEVAKEKYFDSMKEIAGGDVFNLQELIEKFQRCGNRVAAYNCSKALIEAYGSIENASKKVPFSYDTIESWKKKKRGTTLENVVSIAISLGIQPKQLL